MRNTWRGTKDDFYASTWVVPPALNFTFVDKSGTLLGSTCALIWHDLPVYDHKPSLKVIINNLCLCDALSVAPCNVVRAICYCNAAYASGGGSYEGATTCLNVCLGLQKKRGTKTTNMGCFATWRCTPHFVYLVCGMGWSQHNKFPCGSICTVFHAGYLLRVGSFGVTFLLKVVCRVHARQLYPRVGLMCKHPWCTLH